MPSNLLPLRRRLVADDEPVVREVLEQALHTCIPAACGILIRGGVARADLIFDGGHRSILY